MKELKIKWIKWERVPVLGAKEQFDNGLQPYNLRPVITCQLPDGFPVFNRDAHPTVFTVKDRKIIELSMSGYHLGQEEISLSTIKTFEKEFEVKVYSL